MGEIGMDSGHLEPIAAQPAAGCSLTIRKMALLDEFAQRVDLSGQKAGLTRRDSQQAEVQFLRISISSVVELIVSTHSMYTV
jgi:hypothetical protein